MSELVDLVVTGLAALGGSAAFLEIIRRWLQRRQEKRQGQLQLDVSILEEGYVRQEAYQREREALQALSEERERDTRPSFSPWRPRCRRSWRR